MPYPYEVLFSIGKLNVFTYGVFVLIAFFVSLWISLRRRKEISVDDVYNLNIILLVAAIIGARIAYILTNLQYYRTFYDVVALWQGGLSFYGGFALALISSYTYIRIKKLDFWKVADTFAPAFALAMAIGRFGAFLSGVNPGTVTEVPWAIFHEGSLRHPTALYNSLANLVIFFIILGLEKSDKKKLRIRKEGFYFLLVAFLMGLERFALDFFRAYESSFLVLLSRIMPLLIIFVALILIFRRR
ncbi:MAG: prolipoprotein diacylglyceryl transferase [Nanoarchaeota archaeon]